MIFILILIKMKILFKKRLELFTIVAILCLQKNELFYVLLLRISSFAPYLGPLIYVVVATSCILVEVSTHCLLKTI